MISQTSPRHVSCVFCASHILLKHSELHNIPLHKIGNPNALHICAPDLCLGCAVHQFWCTGQPRGVQVAGLCLCTFFMCTRTWGRIRLLFTLKTSINLHQLTSAGVEIGVEPVSRPALAGVTSSHINTFVFTVVSSRIGHVQLTLVHI